MGKTTFFVKRVGTDGSFKKALDLLQEEKYDAAGLGGINLYYLLGEKRYSLYDAEKIKRKVLRPLADGSYLKPFLDEKAIKLAFEMGLLKKNFRAILTSYLDRPWLYNSLKKVGAREVLIGDAAFALKLPVFFSNKDFFSFLGHLSLPILRRVPIKYLYPLGEKQEKNMPRYNKIFAKSQVIAGDFHFIRRFCPDITGKVVITSTLRAEDLVFLKSKGALAVVGAGGDFNGISMGANILEAMAIAYFGKKPWEITESEYLEFLEAISYKPLLKIFSQ